MVSLTYYKKRKPSDLYNLFDKDYEYIWEHEPDGVITALHHLHCRTVDNPVQMHAFHKRLRK